LDCLLGGSFSDARVRMRTSDAAHVRARTSSTAGPFSLMADALRIKLIAAAFDWLLAATFAAILLLLLLSRSPSFAAPFALSVANKTCVYMYVHV